MKEIDFLPEWYKSGRRRQNSHRSQYVALGGVFVVMVVWNLISVHSLSRARGELAKTALEQTKSANASREFAEIRKCVTRLQKKANVLGNIDSRIDIASVLAELSFLIDEDIVLSKVDLKTEGFGGKQWGKASARSGSGVRVANSHLVSSKAVPLGGVKFKVVIHGVAADASDVAELVCKLEDSPYFCVVYPSFSRNKKMTVTKGPAGDSFQVTEFEIGCYLANYEESRVDG
jgi:hypothetical protein